MLIDLKAHYLDLLVGAIEAGGNAALHRQLGEDQGAIYATKSAKETKADYYVLYDFQHDRMSFSVSFADERPGVTHTAFYVEGLDGFWPKFRKAMEANRLPSTVAKRQTDEYVGAATRSI